MIGFYDYTLILTLSSLVSAFIGISAVINEKYGLCVLCLLISGICDGLDGKVARTKKNRTDDEKSFGVQLDSMCDMIAFCALPAVFCYKAGGSRPASLFASCYYCICSVIRLSYYNTMEMKRMGMEHPAEKVYYGLPITSIALILPALVYVEAVTRSGLISAAVLPVFLVTATFFILNIKIRHAGKLAGAGIAAFLVLVLVSSFCSPAYKESGIGFGKYVLEGIRAIS